MSDLTEIITEAVEDAAVTPDVSTDATPVEAGATGDAAPVDTETAVATDTTDTSQQDEFEKRWGIPSRSVTGRENRLPHSRVKTMVTKAEAEALAKGSKDAEAKFTPRITEFETKVKDYEERLGRVAQFENILQNDPRTFLTMLSQIPAYKSFFEQINQLASGGGAAKPEQPYLQHDGMPQPDGPDGLYTLEGLQKRDEWLAKQIESKVVAQTEQRIAERYAPIEKQWQDHQQYTQRMAKLTPVIEKNIADARANWANFNELEPSIIKALKADPSMTLERAYLKSYQDEVIPKMTSDRNKIRSEVLAEIKQKPVASAAPSGQVKPGTQPAAGLSTQDIIANSLREAGLL